MKIFDTNDEVFFEVTDNGIGIPEEEISLLTNSFFRASNVGAISGTGLGLMVADYTIKKHNGVLSVKSKVKEGSVFTIELPKRTIINE